MAANVLADQQAPRFFLGDAPADLDLAPPRRDVSVRTVARSLAGMQKEALVVSSVAPVTVWRLVSDEGPYLDGHDEAPFPLAFLSAGMAASYATELLAHGGPNAPDVADPLEDGLIVTVTNRYTMEGSALRGTMTGGALAPQVHVEVPGHDPVHLRALALRALASSPLHGLLSEELTSRFTLAVNGEERSLGRVAAVDGAPRQPDPAPLFDVARLIGPDDADALLRRVKTAEPQDGVEGGKGSSLQPSQRRTLHVEATCTIRSDGVKVIEVALHRPVGSTFELLSDEVVPGRPPRAPDAATLVSAGLAFCFMTQFGRYATITKRQLDGYRIVQDLHLSGSGIAPEGREGDGVGRLGAVDPVETHVHLDSAEEPEFARKLVDMGEQTCFLHALCRTPLEPTLTVGREA